MPDKELEEAADWKTKIGAFGACEEAVLWLENAEDPRVAWDACSRPDWIMWLLEYSHCASHAELKRALIECVRITFEEYASGNQGVVPVPGAEKLVRDDCMDYNVVTADWSQTQRRVLQFARDSFVSEVDYHDALFTCAYAHNDEELEIWRRIDRRQLAYLREEFPFERVSAWIGL